LSSKLGQEAVDQRQLWLDRFAIGEIIEDSSQLSLQHFGKSCAFRDIQQAGPAGGQVERLAGTISKQKVMESCWQLARHPAHLACSMQSIPGYLRPAFLSSDTKHAHSNPGVAVSVQCGCRIDLCQ